MWNNNLSGPDVYTMVGRYLEQGWRAKERTIMTSAGVPEWNGRQIVAPELALLAMVRGAALARPDQRLAVIVEAAKVYEVGLASLIETLDQTKSLVVVLNRVGQGRWLTPAPLVEIADHTDAVIGRQLVGQVPTITEAIAEWQAGNKAVLLELICPEWQEGVFGPAWTQDHLLGNSESHETAWQSLFTPQAKLAVGWYSSEARRRKARPRQIVPAVPTLSIEDIVAKYR